MRVLTRVLFLIVLANTMPSGAQQWAQILKPGQAIDWSKSGVGEIPSRKTLCARLSPPATFVQINAALRSCPSGQTVYLEPGKYEVDGTINVPSNVTLRGAGADQTILNAKGKNGKYVVGLGTESVRYDPVDIVDGAMAGSTTITVKNPSHIAVGKYLVITETNNPAYVTSTGVDGNCRWCDGEWTPNGMYARGQIVEVTGVKGAKITFTPELYSAYTVMPFAVPFVMSADHAGVEDLQVYANNTGYAANFGMNECAYCWIKGVESNFTDGDHMELYYGFHDEVRDSYFSNAYQHTPGAHDADIRIGLKTSASLIENNILERTHASLMLSIGPAGNVISYNYTMGEFDTNTPNVVIGGIEFHSAHSQYNLLEGNVATQVDMDAYWGSSSHTTVFRNWLLGTNRICSPMFGRGTVSCTGANGHYGFMGARALQISFLSTRNNIVGNVLGSAPMQSLSAWGRTFQQVPLVEYPGVRKWDAAAYGITIGYGAEDDDGAGQGCAAGKPPCHRSGTSSTNLFHGNYSNMDGSTKWTEKISHQLTFSFYLSGKPSWWGTLPFPSIGPDVSGGSGPGQHSYGNPAQNCYIHVMHGSDGGAGSPLVFNASRCYGSAR